MKFRIQGHDRQTAMRDMLIALLPDERHAPDDGLGGDICVSTLVPADGAVRAFARVVRGGAEYNGECTEPAPECGEDRKRAISYAVKTAMFRAILPVLPKEPVWGSLTGVKPAKPVRVYLQEGHTRQEAEKWLRERYFVSENRAGLCLDAAQAALETEDSLAQNEVQLYIGIPFCPSKCAYCSFVSNDIKRWGSLIEPYHAALLREIEAAGEMLRANGLSVGSIYVGGGTPTTLSAAQLDSMLARVRECIPLDLCREFTVEAGRPETVDAEKLKVLLSQNVDRISINPQTLHDSVLEAVARRHTMADILRAYELARKTGDFIINMDLIAGLPSDTGAGLLQSVRAVADLQPENITLHCLARKKGAQLRFEKQEELSAVDFDACGELLRERDYKPYYLYRQKYSAGGFENTGYCKNGQKSRYNICMMEEIGSVVALGAGGISKICLQKGEKIVRICNPKYPLEYIDRADLIAGGKRGLIL